MRDEGMKRTPLRWLLIILPPSPSSLFRPTFPTCELSQADQIAVSRRPIAAVRMTLQQSQQVAYLNKKPQKQLLIRHLGRVEYGAALSLQKETEQAVKAGQQPDTLLLLEHPHTLTVGRRGESSGILLSEGSLQARGVAVFETNRGGKITYHGLGQVVGYPIINLSPHREDVHAYVRDLEEVLIRTLADFEIQAFRIEGFTGVHTARGKIAAIGVHIARWITTHGFALNVNTDLSFFNLIIACDGEQVTSMQDLLGREVDMNEVEDQIAVRFAEVFSMLSVEYAGSVV
jgi:lipoyl(octanoyl) transferase